ncbi:MAG: peptidylprolyl isomerase [Clostridiales bacterium]|jgi:peptidyl-prolyl cis-trans isomerase B (cyclophilin B)|nr:peptidylprolyl isomerase [Clostridiales bacterium]
MLGNIRNGSKNNTLFKIFCGCLSAALLFSVSCSSASPSENLSESPAESAVTEDVSITPEASPTPDPNVTPETVDLSQYSDLPLPQLDPIADGEEIALLHTSLGVIKVRFFPDYAPKAVQNFKTLAKSGYYNGVTFHRVIEDSVIQTGDPTGTGAGGQSIWGQPFASETSPCLHNIYGALSMVLGEDASSQGSQFFIVSNNQLSDETKTEIESYKDKQNQVAGEMADGTKVPMAQLFPEKIIDKYLEVGGVPGLDFMYAVFAQVFDGFDTVDKISSAETSQEEETMNKPLTDIVIEEITFESYSA